MARQKTTVSIDEDLMRHARVRAARTGRSLSDILEEALRDGLGVVSRIRSAADAEEDEVLAVASEVVHEVRQELAR